MGGTRLEVETGPNGPDREERMRHAHTALLGAALLLAAQSGRAEVLIAAAKATGQVAIATVQPLGGSAVKGFVLFTPRDHGVEINADISGLTPGKHGFHIHEFGDCSAPDGGSAGPHFNPEGTPHGAPGAAASHAGDYGNLEADASGHAVLKYVSHRITLDQSATGVLGRSVIVHEKADDMTTQPTGAAGGRIGCGVIIVEGANTPPVTKR
jgi:Cu-Zn family superoxide dismutase